MDISKDIIEKYAKKIYGFAFSKTRDYNDAQDLSQEILIVLFDKGTKLSQIDNMDAYIYRICSYTWMNFYRKDIQKRKNLENASVLEFVADETDIEEEYIKKELHDKLRQEIMYLSKMKREVTIMFYYENKTSKEISDLLNIPDSSVRWYLGESKKTLKERIEMTEQGIYKPIKIG
ncbi:MAG: RNA polymerase sigma factor, partial [Clostridia bacterium]|nr:RNA polymerase sigma factor [Clostridia bacterium]